MFIKSNFLVRILTKSSLFLFPPNIRDFLQSDGLNSGFFFFNFFCFRSIFLNPI